jgi:4-carboxymuconolactone decarboxylase
MGESERYDRGWELIEQIDGQAGERILEGVGSLSPDLARYIIEFAYGDVWARPGLDLKQRELATVSALIALGHAEPELKVHMNGMLRVGWTREEIIEVVLHMAVYAGFPAALNALTIAGQVFDEQDQAKGD